MKRSLINRWASFIFIFLLSTYIRSQQTDTWHGINSDFPQKPYMQATSLFDSSSLGSTSIKNGSIVFSFSLPGYYQGASGNAGKLIIKLPEGSLNESFSGPLIPFYEISLALPPNSEISFVDVITDESQVLSNIELAVNKPGVITPEGVKPARYDEVEIKDLFPEKIYRLVINRLKDGNSRGTLFLYPLQYDPQKKICVLHKNVNLSIHFSYRGYSQRELEQFFGSRVLDKAIKRFGAQPELKKGQRFSNYEVLSETDLGKVYKNSFLVEQDKAIEFSIIAMSNWFAEKNGKVQKHIYGVSTLEADSSFSNSNLEEDSYSGKKSKLLANMALTYKNVREIKHEDDMYSLIQKEWIKSPGIILFNQGDADTAAALTPLASYLNWPLIGVKTPDDYFHIRNLIAFLNSQFIIAGGMLSGEIEKRINFSGISSIYLNNQDEINQFFALQRSKDPSFKNLYVESNEYFYKKMVLNKDFFDTGSIFFVNQYAPEGGYLVLYSTKKGVAEDIDYSSSAAMLAAYRGGSLKNVTDFSASQIQDEIINSNCRYVALMGDGDEGEVSCFYIPDPVSGEEDNLEPGGNVGSGVITSDFYYELTENPEVGTIPDTWDINCYVGRVVGTSELNVMDYIDLIKRYEMGLCPQLAKESSLVASFKKEWDSHVYPIQSWLNSNGGIDNSIGLYATDSPYHCGNTGCDFTDTNYLNIIDPTLYSGISISYIYSHGNYSFIGTSSGIWCQVSKDDLISKKANLKLSPFLQYTHICLNALFMGENTVGIEPSAWHPDENDCIGVNFISNGAIGFIGNTMVSYIPELLDTDWLGIDKRFFEHKITDGNLTMGQALAEAKKEWYTSLFQFLRGDIEKKTVLELILIGDPAVNIQMNTESNPTSNHSPNLSTPLAIPSSGDSTTPFFFEVHYSDVDGDRPSVIRCSITGPNGYSIALSATKANGYDWDGEYRTDDIQFPYAGSYQYQWWAQDTNGGEAYSVTNSFSISSATIPETEPNNNSSQADGPLSSGTTYTGFITPSGDEDWYRIDCPSAGVVVFDFTSPPDTGNDAEFFDANLISLSAFGTAPGASIHFTYSIPQFGTYYLKIFGELNAVRAYTLTYTFIPRSPVWIAIMTDPSLLQINVDGQICTAPYSFNWNPGSQHSIGVPSPQAGGAGIQYVFNYWSDSGAQTHNIVCPGSATTFKSFFKTQYRLSTSANPAAGGTVTPNGTFWYNSGTTLNVQANQNSGYTFTGWGGDYSGTQNPLPVVMDSPKSVVANFASTLNAPNLSSPTNNAVGQPIDAILQWLDSNSNPPEQNYEIRIKPDGGSCSYYMAAQNSVSFAPPGLSNGIKYYWNVRAVGNGTTTLTSPWANGEADWCFITTGIVLIAPTLSQPADGIGGQPTNVSMVWSDTNTDPQEQNYEVRIKQDGGSYSYYTVAQNVTSYPPPGLLYGTKYYWNIRAVGNGSSTINSQWGNGEMDWNFTTWIFVLNPPTLSQPANGMENQPTNMSIQWIDTNTDPQEMGYYIRIMPEGGSYSYDFVPQNDASYAPLGLVNGVTYFWNVMALGDGTSTMSSSWANSDVDWSFTTEIINFPEINIKQGATDISSGNSYDFGSYDAGSNTDVTFTIENLGNAELILDGLPLSISGTNADQFSVQQQPTSPVSASGSTTFIVRFSPTSGGAKSASISIANNDSDEDPYVVNFIGNGVENPLISTLNPDSGNAGDSVTISGGYFGSSQGTVTFNGIQAAISSWADSQIKVTVPVGVTTGPVVVHTTDGKDSNAVTFTVIVPGTGFKIAFVSDRNDPDQRRHLWVINSDKTGLTQLTNYAAPWDVYGPIFSHNGEYVLFNKEDDPTLYRNELWRIRISDNALTLVNNPGSQSYNHCGAFNWSPNDAVILFSSEQSNHNGWFKLWKVNADGTNAVLCNDEGNGPFADFSLDGTQIVHAVSADYNRPSSIRVMSNTCSNDQTIIPSSYWPSTYGPVYNMVWTNTNKIIFCIGPYSGNYGIYCMNPDGSGLQMVVDSPGNDFFGKNQKGGSEAILGNGSRMVYYSNATGNYEIYIINTDGTGQAQLTNNSAEDKYPAFSPDGTKIVWVSNVSGKYAIWMMNSDGTGKTQITDDTGNETEFSVVPNVTCTSPSAPANPSPANGATGVSTGVILDWNDCVNASSYDVYLGTSSTPGKVDTVTDSSYTPASLNPGASYYWEIVAKNVCGETSGSVWSFTTGQVSETVSAPTIPSGPSSGLPNTSYQYTTDGSNSSAGHTVEYQFDWGDGNFSGWLTNGTDSHSWTLANTYQVRARARCAMHTSVVSDWSSALAVSISSGAVSYYNSPANRLIITEVNWSLASGGGEWISEVQLTDISGGSTVQVYYNCGTDRLGPFTLWTNSGGANRSVKFSNIVSTIDVLDGSSFSYYDTQGALEFVTQDTTHLIQAAVRTYNGNYSRTFPALADVETNTAALGRQLMIPNISNNISFRPSVVLFNTGSDTITAEVKIIDSDGVQVGSTINRALAGYEMNVITDEVRAYTYSNAMILITPTSGTGRLMASGQTANNYTNDPAAHVAVHAGSGYPNSPDQTKILTEVNWSLASGGGEWISEVQLIDISGGSTVQVYYNVGTTRLGPFTLWTNSGGANRSVTFSNIVSTIDGLDGSSFSYYNTQGALEFITQDATHLIQAAVRTYNGNFSRTFPGLSDMDANTAASGRVMVVPNICNNATYRPSLVLYNPSDTSATVEVKIVGGDGVQIGSTISRTLAAHEMNVITSEVRANTYDNAFLRVEVVSGNGRVLISGQSANNYTNDPAAHVAVQMQ